jgi:hypothetical protein
MLESNSFEDFPYRKLTIKVPRRDFLYSIVKQMSGTAGKISQKPTYRIEDLGLMPLEDIAAITPALYATGEFQIIDDFIYGKAPRHLEFIKLFPKNSTAHTMLQFFSQHRSISALSISLRKRYSMEKEASLRYIRGLFLFLVEEGFAYPLAGVPRHDE